MSDNATAYLIVESTKKLGAIITTLENLTALFQEVNLEVLAENIPDQIPTFHKMLTNLDQNLKNTELMGTILAVASKER